MKLVLTAVDAFVRDLFAREQAPHARPCRRRGRQLARQAEAVCRHYLSNGYRAGRYWHAGDVANTSGQSLYVRLAGPSAGKWTDAATGEHGDLLDLIALNQNLPLKDALAEARQFLALPQPQQHVVPRHRARSTSEAARRLFAMARPIPGTMAETYLRARGITGVCQLRALRFHPNCFYGGHNAAGRNAGPALIAAATDLRGRITGVQRTWLDVSGRGKAPISTPRRALGHLLSNGVHFGKARDVLLAGEGIETVLSLKMIMPRMPMVAALSASHLAALVLPPSLERLYIACDADRAGRRACERLAQRAEGAGITVLALHPRRGDFNDDLRIDGPEALSAAQRAHVARDDLPCVIAKPMPAGESEGA